MANLKCDGVIESKELKIGNGSIKDENGVLKMLASGGFSLNGVDLLNKILTIDDFYVDLANSGNSAKSTTASYVKIEIPNSKNLVIVWGTTPETDSTGYLTGAPSGTGWVPTNSTGTVYNFFTKQGQYRVIATPYAGTLYNYGWRVSNYVNNGAGGFNIRYGDTVSGIRFSFIMIGIVDKE